MLDQLGVHLAYSHAETGPLPNWLDQRIIFLHRDPRDVLVSTWFELRFRADQSEIDFADLFGCPRHGLEAIVDFNLLWAAEVSEARGSLALSYETMMADPAATLERTLVWLGVERCDEAIRRAVEAGRFERMRELETSGQGARLYGAALAPFDSARPDSFKTRRGGSGSWREHFSAEQVVMAERILAERDYWVRMSAEL